MVQQQSGSAGAWDLCSENVSYRHLNRIVYVNDCVYHRCTSLFVCLFVCLRKLLSLGVCNVFSFSLSLSLSLLFFIFFFTVPSYFSFSLQQRCVYCQFRKKIRHKNKTKRLKLQLNNNNNKNVFLFSRLFFSLAPPRPAPPLRRP